MSSLNKNKCTNTPGKTKQIMNNTYKEKIEKYI